MSYSRFSERSRWYIFESKAGVLVVLYTDGAMVDLSESQVRQMLTSRDFSAVRSSLGPDDASLLTDAFSAWLHDLEHDPLGN